MCGILGIIAAPGQTVGIDRPQVLAMRDAMFTRGPDGPGLFERRNVVFAHRRLAIRDAAGGAQPWVSQDGECVLVYNGELYNDGELRGELTALGHTFRSHCDTEVVLASFQEWGPECVRRLRGMFAFGIYDFREDILFLARDRFGVKPLFLAEIDGTLAFASSIAALVRHPGYVKSPDFAALSHYLTTFRTTLGRRTVFEGIRQLLPAERLTWRCGDVRIDHYWDYPREEEDRLDYEDSVALLEGGLRDAVRSQLVSDVPVGAFLSGGVDSSTLACLMQEGGGRTLPGFCGGGDADASHDFPFARDCARHVRFDHTEVRVSADEYLDCWEWMIDRAETPLSTPTDVIIFRLATEARKAAGVILGGEGADELLCGYAVPHWAGHDFDQQQELDTGRSRLSSAAARMFRESLLRQYGRDRFSSAEDHYFALNSLIPSAVKSALLQPHAWQAAGEDAGMREWYAHLFRELGDQTTLRRDAILLHRVNLEALLSRLDNATMLAGLEARVPYTDHLLVEQMFRVPQRFKIDVSVDEEAPFLASGELEQRGTLRSKRPLRTLADRLMPAALARRRKASFPTPVATWLAGPWSRWARDTLLASRFARGIFQPAALREIAENVPRFGMCLWPLLNIALWGDRQFTRG